MMRSSHVDPAFPLIDLVPWYAGSASGKAAVADAVRAACGTIGFFAVTGHRVPPNAIEAMRATSRAFFDLPMAEKMKVARPRPSRTVRIMPRGTETLARLAGNDSPPDYKEVFAIGPPDVPADDPWYHTLPDAYPNCAPTCGQPNRPVSSWRGVPTGPRWRICKIRSATSSRRRSALPEGWFDRALARHCSMLRALNYPAQATPPAPGQLRAGAHTDLGMLTILKNEAADGGLEVRDLAGRWHEAPPCEEGFIVNIGDLLMRWTNDRFRSTLHRVGNPRSGGGARRLSIAYFVAPAYDTLIECLPTCQTADAPEKYPPITVATYRNARFARTAA